MKYAIIVPDGMADRPIEKLGGKTPLEMAETANMDKVVYIGRLGRVKTVPKGMAAGSDVAIMSVLGYDPLQHHPGRASLEAANLGMTVSEDDAVFRCNLVTISDGAMADYSAGQITTKEAEVLVATLNEKLSTETVSFHLGTGYRHIMLLRGGASISPKCFPPHDILLKNISKYLPSGDGADVLTNIMERSGLILAEHEVNRVRIDLGENPANMVWLWGMGLTPHIPSFRESYELTGAVVAAVDLVKGLAKIIGWDQVDVAGATAGLDTNYEGKGDAAIDALKEHDLVLVHIEATDEAGHAGNISAKIDAIHEVDAHIVGPIMRYLQEQEDYRLLVLPDHPTPIELRTHSADPVPFALCGSNVAPDHHETFTETQADESDLLIEPGHELMEYFLSGRA